MNLLKNDTSFSNDPASYPLGCSGCNSSFKYLEGDKEMIALISEVWNDRHGDLHKGADVVIRAILLVLEGAMLRFTFHKPFIICLMLSTSIFFLFFDYIITYILIKNGTVEPPRGVRYNWFTYEAKSGIFDTMDWWKFSPWLRVGIKLAYFLVSLVLFIKI